MTSFVFILVYVSLHSIYVHMCIRSRQRRLPLRDSGKAEGGRLGRALKAAWLAAPMVWEDFQLEIVKSYHFIAFVSVLSCILCVLCVSPTGGTAMALETIPKVYVFKALLECEKITLRVNTNVALKSQICTMYQGNHPNHIYS